MSHAVWAARVRASTSLLMSGEKSVWKHFCFQTFYLKKKSKLNLIITQTSSMLLNLIYIKDRHSWIFLHG